MAETNVESFFNVPEEVADTVQRAKPVWVYIQYFRVTKTVRSPYQHCLGNYICPSLDELFSVVTHSEK